MNNGEAIKIINQYDMNFYWNIGEPIPAEQLAEAFDLAISALKQQERDRWIPVTERLPKDDDYKPFSYYEDGAVLYCTKDGKIGFGWYYESTREWANEDDISPGEVIAWMPRPEPYKAEDEA